MPVPTVQQLPAGSVVAIRNNVRGITTFSDPKFEQVVKWEAIGDPNGEDIQEVSAEMFNSAQFRKMVHRGVFAVVDDQAEVQAAIEAQAQGYTDRTAAESAALQGAVVHEQNNDLIAVSCIGPSGKVGHDCGVQVPVRDKTSSEKPPLCAQHEHLAPEYVPVDSEEIGSDGKPIQHWVRMSVGSREREIAVNI